MIDTLADICRQLLVLAGLSLFLDVLLPGGALKKYSQLVMGLLLVAALVQPLLSLTAAPSAVASVFVRPEDNTAAIIAAGSELAAGAGEAAADELAESLARQISSLAGLVEGVEAAEVDVEVEIDGAEYPAAGYNWGEVVIVLTVAADKMGEAETVRREVAGAVADFYGIEPTAVQVSLGAYADSP